MVTPISIWDDQYQMPADPILGSDSFIAADTDSVAAHIGDGNDDGKQTEQLNVPPQPPNQDEQKSPLSDPLPSFPPTQPDPLIRSDGDEGFGADVKPHDPLFESDMVPEPDPLLGSDAFIAADTDAGGDGGASRTPVTGSSEAKPARRSRKGPEDVERRPDWLPDSWEMTCKTRTSGATAGITDRYYVEPTSRKRFRSKNEVLHYLETGSSKLKKKLNSDANATPSDTPGKDKEKSGTKTKKSGTKRKREAPWTFDFQNPPEEVCWALIDENLGLWKPSIADEQVSETSTLEWTTTFKRVCEMA